MFKFVCLLFLYIYCIPSLAFTVKGKVRGVLPAQKVYLFTSDSERMEHKWTLSCKVDSALVDANGFFLFNVPDKKFAQLWRIVDENGSNIKYFFSKDEDISFVGEPINFVIVDKEVFAGRDHLLMKDIMDMMEDENFNQSLKCRAVEWLERHVREDVSLWATAYYSLVNPVLSLQEVQVILGMVPKEQQINPHYLLLKKWMDKYSLLQVGGIYNLPKLKKNDGSFVIRQNFQGNPLLVFSCSNPQMGRWYRAFVDKIVHLTKIEQNLHVLLIFPQFVDTTVCEVLNNMSSENVQIVNYANQEKVEPSSLNLMDDIGLILIDSQSRILSLSQNIDELKECLQKKLDPAKSFEICGYVEGRDDGIAELWEEKDGGLLLVDTVHIRHGEFRFYGEIPYPKVYYVGIRGTYSPVYVFVEHNSINVCLWQEWHIVEGQEVCYLKGKVYGSKVHSEFKEASALVNNESVIDWISKHSDSWAAFYRIFYWVEVESPERLLKWSSLLNRKFKNYPEYKVMKDKIERSLKVQEGEIAPEFSLKDSDGNQFSLSECRGKYVVLDFWASWCGPCRNLIPYLKKLWAKYSDRDFEIISISLDGGETAWRKALAQEKMPWKQLLAAGSQVDQLYCVSQIPHLLLLDPQGRIIAVNIRGVQLEEKLEKLLK